MYVDNFIEVLPLALLGLREQEGTDDDRDRGDHGGALRAARSRRAADEALAGSVGLPRTFPTIRALPTPSPSRRRTSPGSLHMGHALNDTIQDILIRYHHLRGFNTLWVVGTDHAGIATQNKVEGQSGRGGPSQGGHRPRGFREAGVGMAPRVRLHHHPPAEALGCACDYESERFTMDEAYQKAVVKVFVSLYEKGDIYRDVYLVNWCVRCGSAISDLEVEHEDRAAKLYYVKYPIAGSDETSDGGHHSSGDHPGRHGRGGESQGPALRPVRGQAPRWCRWWGGRCPSSPTSTWTSASAPAPSRSLPAHDPDDWEIGMRHGLPSRVGHRSGRAS